MKATLEGRTVGNSRGGRYRRGRREGATQGRGGRGRRPEDRRPKGGAGVKLSDGSVLAADGQLAGTPSVVFDAVAVLLSPAGAKLLAQDSAAIEFVRDAFGHLKAVAVDAGGKALLDAAGVKADAGVIDASDKKAFLAAAKTRQWAREPNVRILA